MKLALSVFFVTFVPNVKVAPAEVQSTQSVVVLYVVPPLAMKREGTFMVVDV